MSRTKKLTMARRRNRALAAENFSLLMACAEMQIQNRRLSAEMKRIKEELRPAVERIAAIRYDDRWYFAELVPEHAQYERMLSFDPASVCQQTFRQRVINTHRKLEIRLVVADEVLLEMIGSRSNDLLEKFFIETGVRMFTRAITESRKKVT